MYSASRHKVHLAYLAGVQAYWGSGSAEAQARCEADGASESCGFGGTFDQWLNGVDVVKKVKKYKLERSLSAQARAFAIALQINDHMSFDAKNIDALKRRVLPYG